MKKQYVATMIAGVAALAIAGSASAQTVLRLTGSTAFRGATHNAIKAMMDPGYTYGFAGSSLGSAGQAEFRGTVTISGVAYPVDIKTSWSGSVAGVQSLDQGLTLANWLNSSSLSTTGTPSLSGPYDAATKPDVAMADSFQSSSLYTSVSLADTVVGVCPFEWIANPACPAGLNNMTARLAMVFLNGSVPANMLTGNGADAAVTVYPVGRDESSGTRVDTFAETGYGVFGAPFQYQVAINGVYGAGGSATNLVTAVQPWPQAVVLGVTYPVGHSGYGSGGTLASVIGTPSSIALIGYAGISDANTAIGIGAKALTYNGVAYSPTAVEEGSYTFWAYEHLMYRSDLLTGTPKAIADKLATTFQAQTTAQLAPAGIALSDMHVSRPIEGGDITSQ